MKVNFKRKRFVLLILGFMVFQCLYVLGLMYLGKSNSIFASFANVFGEPEAKPISVLMIQYANSTPENKYFLNLTGFMGATESYPQFDVSVVEGVGNNLLIFSDIIDKAHDEGVRNIFLFGFPYGLEMENIFRRYQDISFYYYNGKATGGNVRNYGVSIFMEKYYLGMLAGMQTLTNNIGYISDFPFVEYMRSINYFARGVEFVNPNATVNVVWTGNSFDKEVTAQAVQKLHDNNAVDVVTGSMIACYWCDKAEELHMYYIGQHTDDVEKDNKYYLSSYELDYRQVYLRLFSMINSGFNGFGEDITWFNETDGAVNISSFSPLVSRETVQRIGMRRSQLLSCDDYVFRGPVYSNDGQMIAPANSLVTDKLLSNKVLSLYKNIKENVLDENGNLSRWESNHTVSSSLVDDSFYEQDLRQQGSVSLSEMDKAACKKFLDELKAQRN